ncbi:MAG: class I SAM-dependent methyltransferase [Halioglobus sp.]
MQLEHEKLGRSYNSDYYGAATSKFVHLIEKLLQIGSKQRAKSICDRWRASNDQELKSPDMLDIGCGRGHLLNAFRGQGWNALGLERNEFPVNKNTDESVKIGSIYDPEFAEKKFDVVVLWHVFEHLEGHFELLEKLAQHQKVNSLLVIAVPNFSSTQQKLFSKHWFHLDLPRHLVHFERDWLRTALTSSGYEIESFSSFDFLQNTFGFIQSSMNIIFKDKKNVFYNLLKNGRYFEKSSIFPSIGWTIFAIALLPLALLEGAYSALMSEGATIKMVARLKDQND